MSLGAPFPEQEGARLQSLLSEGLEQYGRGDEAGAIACWHEALRICPGNADALDYLESAGASVTPPAPESLDNRDTEIPAPGEHDIPQTAESYLDAAALLALIKERNYEEALEMLYDARMAAPDDGTVSRSLMYVKGRLARRYVREIGTLDAVPVRGTAPTSQNRSHDALLVFVDGIVTNDDIVRLSPFGRFRTLQILAELRALGAIVIDPDASSGASADIVASAPAATAPTAEPQPLAVVGSNALDAYFSGDFRLARQLFERGLIMTRDRAPL